MKKQILKLLIITLLLLPPFYTPTLLHSYTPTLLHSYTSQTLSSRLRSNNNIQTLLHSYTSTLKHLNTSQRIISLKPNITELLFAIGAGGQVVGVTKWCDRPEAAKKLPRVADYIEPNLEKIVALEPDLVISSEENSIKTPIKVLERTGVPVMLLPFKTVDDLLASTMKLATATGHEKEGGKLVDGLRAVLDRTKHPPLTLDPSPSFDRLRTPQKGEGETRTLIIVGRRPLIAAGAGTFLGELLEAAGGKNIISGKIPYPHVNVETVLARDPEVIIDLSMGSEKGSKVEGQRSKVKEEFWEEYPVNAVKNGRVYALDISDFRAGPRIGEQIEKLRELLSPPPL